MKVAREYWVPRDGRMVRMSADHLDSIAIKNRHLRYRANGVASLTWYAKARPETCERCGASGALNGHHNDYAKIRDVEWLCHHCHMERHAELRVQVCEALGGMVVERRQRIPGDPNMGACQRCNEQGHRSNRCPLACATEAINRGEVE